MLATTEFTRHPGFSVRQLCSTNHLWQSLSSNQLCWVCQVWKPRHRSHQVAHKAASPKRVTEPAFCGGIALMWLCLKVALTRTPPEDFVVHWSTTSHTLGCNDCIFKYIAHYGKIDLNDVMSWRDVKCVLSRLNPTSKTYPPSGLLLWPEPS